MALLARDAARHHEAERVVEIGAFDAALDHHARDIGDVGRHAPGERRVVCDEPEQLRIGEVAAAFSFSVDLRVDDPIRQQARLRIEELP